MQLVQAVVFGALMLMLLAIPNSVQAATCTSSGAGNWSNTAHWTACGGTAPKAGDIVIIATATTLDTNSNAIASLTVNTGQTLTVGNSGVGRTLTVTGNVTLTGTGTITAFTTAATHSLFIGGSLSNAGTFNGLNGAGCIINTTFNGAAQSISGAGATTFNNITVNNGSTVTFATSATMTGVTVGGGASGVLTFDNAAVRTLTITGSVTVNAGAQFITQAAGAQIHVINIAGSISNAGTFDLSQGSVTVVANVTFNGVAQSVTGGGATTRFNNVTINNGSTVTLSTTNATTMANVTVGSGASGVLTFDAVASRTLTLTGNLSISAGGQFITQAAGTQTHTVNLAGNLTNAGTFDMTRNGATLLANVTFNGAAQGVTGAGGTTRFNNVSINNGSTVTLSTTSATTMVNVTVGQGATGVLTFDAAAARTLTISGNVTVNAGAQFITQAAGTQTHIVSIAGNLTNGGTFDMSRGGATFIANVTFNGSVNQTVSGSGATTRFNNIIVNNSVPASIININTSNFTAAAGFLTLTSGIFELSGTFAAFSNTLFSTAAYTIPANAGLWINNPNVTVTAQNADATLSGLLRISQGTYNVGTVADNELLYATGSTIDIQGGALNVTGGIQGTNVVAGGTTNTTTYSQSAGIVTVAVVNVSSDVTTGGKSFGSFDIHAAGSSFTMSGGTIVLQNPTNVQDDYVVGATLGSVTGGTLQVGSASTTINNPYAMTSTTPVFNLTIKGTVSPFAELLTSPLTVKGNVLIETGATLNTLSLGLNVAGNWTNNGTFTSGTQTTTFNGSSGAQTIGGSSATAFSGLTISNSVNLNTNGSVASGATLTLNNDLTTDGANSIVLTATGATMAGTADVVGSVLRTDVGAAAVAFGNPNVQVTNATAMTLTVTLAKQAPANFSSAVMRVYTLTIGAGSVSGATLRFHYLNAELQANTATTLDLYRATGVATAAWVDNGNIGVTRTTAAEPNNWIQQTGIIGFSSWTLANSGQAPTAVRLTRFNAAMYEDGVALAWQSGYEVNNLGYHVYREENGKRSRVTPSIVAGSALTVGPGNRLAAGFSYSWFDPQGTANTAYYLESVDLNGSRETVGPIYPLGAGNGPSPKHQRALLLRDVAASVATNAIAAERSWATALPQSARNALVKIKAGSLSVQQAIAAGQAVKIQVSHAGWYHVSQPELAAAGLASTVDVRMLQLYVDGEEVPIRITGDGSHLGAGDALEFYGVGLDTPTTDTRTYWLVTSESAGKRISSPKRNKAKGTDLVWAEDGEGVRNFANTTERREKLSYFPNLLNGDEENIFGNLVTTDPISESVTVKTFDRDFGGQPQLEIALQGATQTPHEVRVELNGTSLGTITFDSQQHPVQRFSLDRALLHDGENAIALVASGSESDVSFVDWIRLTYARRYTAENNALQFSVGPGQTARVSGFTTPDVRVLDITNPDLVTELSTVAGPTGASFGVKVQTRGSDTRTYLAFASEVVEPVASVKANQPSSWNAASNGADMVILTHGDFRQAVEPLANLRRSQGLSVAVVDVEDVYDEFTYGAHTPLALKVFLSWAAAHWNRAPQYLLLVGDSSWDPRNYLGQGDNDLVPTKLLDTSSMETASDDWLVDFNGDDLADMAVGRLPAHTVADVNLMVRKIMIYEQERDSNAPLRGAVMVSDRGFESQSTQTRALLPATMAVEMIDRGVVNDDNEARSQIVAAIDQGPLIVNYYGHGSVDVWTGSGLLNDTNALTLTNGDRVSLFVMMTCLNGYAHDVYIDSLAEAAMKAENGGAVAVWASSGFTEPEPQFAMNSEFYRQLFGTQPVRLGEAIRSAKQATTDLDVRRTWILFGDPAMRIR